MKTYIKRVWFTPKIPDVHIDVKRGSGIRIYFSKWVLQPPKRWLAYFYLRLLRKLFGLKVIGITGSAGKTTVKEMIASILKTAGKTVRTKANIDPVYNISSTILKCNPFTKYLVLEMGVEYPGEMDFYLWLAKPDIGLIMNIFPTHTEFFGNVDGVFKEKKKLVLSLQKGDIAVLNSGDKKLKNLAGKLKAEVFWFRSEEDPVLENANAAGKVSEILKVSKENIGKGLKTYLRPEHRLATIKTKSGAVIFDDSYNSNPEALLATLGKFNKLAGKGTKIAVLGDMLELGKIEEREHRRVGREVSKSGFRVLIGVGSAVRFLISEVNKYSKETKTYLFSKPEEALPLLRTLLSRDTFVLIKGSRSIGLDRVVYNLN